MSKVATTVESMDAFFKFQMHNGVYINKLHWEYDNGNVK
jgi:hypothetical protein